jgi:carbon storage regulator
MLVLTRKVGETLVIDGRITVTVIGFRGHQIRLGIVAPTETRILRGELVPFANGEESANQAASSDANANLPAAAVAAGAAAASLAAASDEGGDLTFDPTMFATADAMVCESFATSHALGEHRGRHEADEEDTISAHVAGSDSAGSQAAGSPLSGLRAGLSRPVTAAAKPARPRRALGLRGFRETRRIRTHAGAATGGSAAVAANRSVSEQPAAASVVEHTARATAG